MNFQQPFEHGQKLAVSASKSKKEIREVFAVANVLLKEKTGQRFSFQLARRPELGILGSPILDGNSGQPLYYTCLDLVDSKRNKKEEVAKLNFHYKGYPFEIELNGQKIICNKKHELEIGLSKLLADERVAIMIHDSMEEFTFDQL